MYLNRTSVSPREAPLPRPPFISTMPLPRPLLRNWPSAADLEVGEVTGSESYVKVRFGICLVVDVTPKPYWLVVEPTPLKNMKVNWDYYSR